jgi:hypothetical protein
MSHSATTTVAAPRSSSLRELIVAAVTGQLAGLVMAVVVMAVFTIFLGKGPLFPVQVIGSFAFGDAAVQGGVHVPALLAGLVLHQLGPALGWSLVFGLLVRALDARRGAPLLALGLAVGLASQLVDVNLILGRAMTALHGHDLWAEHVPAFWSWAAHVVFGLALAALHPAVSRRLAR